VADEIGRSLLAEQQGESVDEDGLARPGFAGQEVQARAEFHHHVIDDSVVFDAKLEQHGATWLLEVEARIA
jgi:hypothetical protein